jgi:hypothetical protein
MDLENNQHETVNAQRSSPDDVRPWVVAGLLPQGPALNLKNAPFGA